MFLSFLIHKLLSDIVGAMCLRKRDEWPSFCMEKVGVDHAYVSLILWCRIIL